MINHLLLEIICLKSTIEPTDNTSNNTVCPECCTPNYSCLSQRCPYLVFTSHENALCYVGEKSITEEIISLGGDMLPCSMEEQTAQKAWQDISCRKILEAYDEYMAYITKMQKN